MEDMIKQAIQAGLTGICFTEHLDPDYPKTPDNLKFSLDIPSYHSQLMKLKDAYKEQIEIHFGIELGLQLHLGKYFHDLLEKYPVKRKVYLTLQKIYSGSGAESAKVLIRYLEQKNKKETPNVWGAAAFAAIGIGQLQGSCGEEWKSSFSTMLMLIVVILGLGILYAGLRTHYSVGISQIWIAGILFWLSFLGLITTISDNLFWDADTGIFLAVMVWFESIIWMVILGIRAIVLKIKNRR